MALPQTTRQSRCRGTAAGTKLCSSARPDGDINTTALLAALSAVAQACFIRAGVANEVQKAQPQ